MYISKIFWFSCLSIWTIPYLHLHPGHGWVRFCFHWASFTLAKLVNIAETASARISARVKCKHTPFVHMILGKIWRRPGQAKCKWDISPTMHDLLSQFKSEGSPGLGQTGEDNFGEGLVRLSVNRVLMFSLKLGYSYVETKSICIQI